MLRSRWARNCSTSRSYWCVVSSSSRCGCGSMRTKSTIWLTSRTTSREMRRRIRMKWSSSSCSSCSCCSTALLLYTITLELSQSSQVRRIIRSDSRKTRVDSFWLSQACPLQLLYSPLRARPYSSWMNVEWWTFTWSWWATSSLLTTSQMMI